MQNILENISILLSKSQKLSVKDHEIDSNFHAECRLPLENFQIKVEGLGELKFPLDQKSIQDLIHLSSKAKFGLREKTLLDETVRNTQEISSDKLEVIVDSSALEQMLSQMADTLGLDQHCKLIPHLHNLLIYEPEQFFNPHQDSEKLENMVATLVVVLPSTHIGGNLLIEHGKKKYLFSSENIDEQQTQCVAFYSDCKHAVEKIKQGYRIALTYNLTLQSKKRFETQKANLNLQKAIQAYFNTDREDSEQDDQSEPQKLIYFLDHSYTEHSLRWDMLKGTDRHSAAMLYTVAKALHLVPHLALVEIHQSWTTDENEYKPKIDELIEEETNLSYWVDSENKKLPFKTYYVSDDEICCTKETAEFEPIDSNYEGYMGNYGDTMDYWYRRAAVVLWRESDQIPMQFMLDAEGAIDTLLRQTYSLGNEQLVLNIIQQAGTYLSEADPDNEKNIFCKLVDIVCYIKNADIAFSIVSNFRWNILNNHEVISSFIKLQNQYGVNWCEKLLIHWKENKSYYNLLRLDNLDAFIVEWLKIGGDKQILEILLNQQFKTLCDQDKESLRGEKPARLQKNLPQKIQLFQQLLVACGIAEHFSILEKVIQYLISSSQLYTEESLAKLFFNLQEIVQPHLWKYYATLKTHLIAEIQEKIALGKRFEDDWSILIKLPCSCEHCKTAQAFLSSKTEKSKIWPIVMEIRKHIFNVFEDMGLPVDLSVEKKGSPHKLVIVKNEKLHQEAQRRWDALNAYHKRLTNHSL